MHFLTRLAVLSVLVFPTLVADRSPNETLPPILITYEEPLTFLTPGRELEIVYHRQHFIPFQDMIRPLHRSGFYGFPAAWKDDERVFQPVYFLSGYLQYRPIDLVSKGNHSIIYNFLDDDNVKRLPWYSSSLLPERSEFYSFYQNRFNAYFLEISEPVEDYTQMWIWYFHLMKSFREFKERPAFRKKEFGITDGDHLAAAFIVSVCTKYSGDAFMAASICPNVCRTQPCAYIANTANVHCTKVDLGMYEHDFRCSCRHNFVWSDITHRCELLNPCSNPSTSPCNRNGTEHCVYMHDVNRAMCQCKLEFMGDQCQRRRNPCSQRANPANVPGDRACNVAVGNECLANLGTDAYRCRCSPRWTQDFSFNYDNCYQLNDRCSGVVCLLGDCVSSPDGQTTKCLCPSGYIGPNCDRIRAHWALWSSWSGCDPRCGALRRQVRVRSCNGELCEGAARAVRLCNGDWCGEHLAFKAYGVGRWKTALLFGFIARWLIILAAAYGAVVIGLMWLVVIVPAFAARLIIIVRGARA